MSRNRQQRHERISELLKSKIRYYVWLEFEQWQNGMISVTNWTSFFTLATNSDNEEWHLNNSRNQFDADSHHIVFRNTMYRVKSPFSEEYTKACLLTYLRMKENGKIHFYRLD